MSWKRQLARLLMLVLPACSFSAQQIRQGKGTIQVNVTMVLVPVLVTEKGGKHVSGLRQTDFQLFEDNKEQKIAELIPGADPFQVALMIDSSGSTHFQLDEIQNAAIAFTEALRPQDRIMIVSFDSTARFDTELTSDREQLRQAIRQPHPEGGQTRLYDALAKVHERLGGAPGRKAIVLFSDGVDNTSIQDDASGIQRMIERSDVIAYAIQYDTRRDLPPDRFHVPPSPGYASFDELYRRAVKYLRRVTAQSGGRVFDAGTPAALTDAFAQIAQELQRQYTLGYYPYGRPDDSFHRIRVKVNRPDVTVRARPGYRMLKKSSEAPEARSHESDGDRSTQKLW